MTKIEPDTVIYRLGGVSRSDMTIHKITEYFTHVAALLNTTVRQYNFELFDSGGITATVVWGASGAMIHTYPEHNILTITIDTSHQLGDALVDRIKRINELFFLATKET